MKWVERVNGNGLKFLQWQRTSDSETLPEWGPDKSITACPVCGEIYESRYMDVAGIWHDSKRLYIYHDPVRHGDYGKTAPVTTVAPPREPGDA